MINRNHKDRLFQALFGGPESKEDLLSLYNALNGTEYTNADDLTIYIIEDAIYMGMKNDVSCILDNSMTLFEQQSSYNPNMPLRGLIYFGKQYEALIKQTNLSLYGRKLVSIPVPKYYVLYNGSDPAEDITELRLSDAFAKKSSGGYEWTAIMVNINKGCNEQILKKCPTLFGYSTLIDRVKRNKQADMSAEEAIDEAVNYCLDLGVLRQYLTKHKAEVRGMLLTEYNEVETMRYLRDEAREEGIELGIELGITQGVSQERRKALQALMGAFRMTNPKLTVVELQNLIQQCDGYEDVTLEELENL